MSEEKKIHEINVVPPAPVYAKFTLETPEGEKISRTFTLSPWDMHCDKWQRANFPEIDNVLDPVISEDDYHPLISAFIRLLSDDDLKWLLENSGNDTAEALTEWLMGMGKESKIQVPVFHAVGETLRGSHPESEDGEGEGKKKALRSFLWTSFLLLFAASSGFLLGKWGSLLLGRFTLFLSI